jgi:hypothetical protein
MSASLFGGGSNLNVNASGTLVPQTFIATAGQTVFNITFFTYTQNTNSLLVFVNGSKQRTGTDFAETSTSSFTLVEACTAGDVVEIIGFPLSSVQFLNTAAGLSYTPAGTGAVATTVQAKLRESVSVFDFMTSAQKTDVINGTGSISISAAWQAAVDYCRDSATCKTIIMPCGTYLHTIPLNVTTSARNGISCIGIGSRRGGVTIKCSTAAWAVELVGSAWTRWTGIYFTQGSSTISKGCFLLGGTATDTECLNHNFENIFIAIYNAGAPSSYGTIGYGVIGSEENTWIATQTYAGTPLLISTQYSTISTDYPSTHQTVQASHSAGVNTLAGENMLVCWDLISANVVLYGANSVDLGNVYCSNLTVGTPGSAVEVIRVLGGTCEGVKGKLKVESKQILLNITSASAQMTGWDLDCQWGAMTANTNAWIKFNNASAFTGEFVNSQITFNLYNSAATEFNNKPIITSINARDDVGACQFSNLLFRINKPFANIGAPWFPFLVVGPSFNVKLECTDLGYTLQDSTTQRINIYKQYYLGGGNASPSTVATIVLPAIVAGYSARSGTVLVSGIIDALNWNDGSGGNETDLSQAPFWVANSFISPNTGVIAVGAAGGDSFITPSASAISTNSGSYLYTGVKLDLVYNSGPRTISINVGPKGTGASIGGILAFLDGFVIELKTIGRKEEIIYMTMA